jgi:hypothetical protein
MSVLTAVDPEHTYTEADLRVLDDPLDWIRARPGMFFTQGVFSPEAAASEIVGEALVCQVTEVTVTRLADWWIISGAQDWLPSGAAETPFRRIVPFPEAGANSMRAEVLLTAFCRDVVTQAPAGRVTISGRLDGALAPYLERTRQTAGRTVAFRC